MKRTLLALTLSCLSVPAFASDSVPSTEYDFLDGDLVQGDMQTSDLAFINLRRARPRTSLIRVRSEFIRELLHSVNSQ